MNDTPRPICRRSPDRLEPGMVIRFNGFDKPETLRDPPIVYEGTHVLLRTTVNAHSLRIAELVEVVAEFVAGVGFVAPVGEVDA